MKTGYNFKCKEKDRNLFFQAIANESGINFISVKGPELLNMVGVK